MLRQLLVCSFALITVLGMVSQAHSLWEAYRGVEFYQGDLEVYTFSLLAVLGAWVMTQVPRR